MKIQTFLEKVEEIAGPCNLVDYTDEDEKMKPTGKSVAAAAVQAVGVGYTYDEMDCQAFVEYCVRQAGGRWTTGGATTWRRHAVWHGNAGERQSRRETGARVPGC